MPYERCSLESIHPDDRRYLRRHRKLAAVYMRLARRKRRRLIFTPL